MNGQLVSGLCIRSQNGPFKLHMKQTTKETRARRSEDRLPRLRRVDQGSTAKGEDAVSDGDAGPAKSSGEAPGLANAEDDRLRVCEDQR